MSYDRQCDSPCELPVKSSNEYQLCQGVSKGLLTDNLCDPDSVLSLKSQQQISKYLGSVEDLSLEVYNLVIYYLRTLVLPPMDDHLIGSLTDKRLNFSRNHEVPELCDILYSLELTQAEVEDHWDMTNVTLYLEAFASALRKVWFRDHSCSERNVLILVITETVVTHTGTAVASDLTHVISVGSSLASILTANHIDKAKSFGQSCVADLVGGTIRLVSSLQLAFESWKQTQMPQHSIPNWATNAFIGCFFFIVFLVFLDWLIITRLQLKARVGSMGSGKPPTRVFMSNISKMRKTSVMQ